MFSKSRLIVTAMALAVAGTLALVASDADALDGYRDRKGPMGGIGMGGGAAFQGGEVGGDMSFDVQLGGAPTQRLTVAMDLDFRFQFVDDYVNWMLVPGPEINVFLVDGLFLKAGVGLALTFPDDDMDQGTVKVGFDGNLGLGYEFFLSSNTAMALSVEGNYILIDDLDDSIVVGMWLGLRFY